MTNKNTFSKVERLCHKRLIEELFKGKSCWNYPFKVFWKEVTLKEEIPAQVLISVSKKKFKHAVDRNRIKRLIREAYRKNKHILYDPLIISNKQLIFGITYQTNKQLTFSEIESKIIEVLNQIVKDAKLIH